MSESNEFNRVIPPDSNGEQIQHIVVMRHGDRIDNVEPLWISTAKRPFDPPLAEPGKVRAFCTGRKLRNNLDFPIHRVFVSPFRRCIQTASEVISGLCAINDDPLEMTSDNIKIDPSKVKVSIELGLCEILNREAIGLDMAPNNGNWGFDVSELESLLPAGTVDKSVVRVYKELIQTYLKRFIKPPHLKSIAFSIINESSADIMKKLQMPRWEESITEARARYLQVVQAVADKFPSENLLFVTHGEAIGAVVSSLMKDTTVYGVEYCGYTQPQRRVSIKSNGTFVAGNFEIVALLDQFGVSFCPTSQLSL